MFAIPKERSNAPAQTDSQIRRPPSAFRPQPPLQHSPSIAAQDSSPATPPSARLLPSLPFQRIVPRSSPDNSPRPARAPLAPASPPQSTSHFLRRPKLLPPLARPGDQSRNRSKQSV